MAGSARRVARSARDAAARARAALRGDGRGSRGGGGGGVGYLRRPSPAVLRLESHQLVRPQPEAVAETLHAAVYRIVTTFYEHLDNFALAPKYAKRLAPFLSFRQ